MFSVDLSDLTYLGENLSRPECVLSTRSGDIFIPDKRGGISDVRADVRTELILGRNAPQGFMPNGFALLPCRSFLIADLGPDGGVWHMAPDGTLTPKLMEIDGKHLEPTNFVGIDAHGRTWISVSTRLIPREGSMKKGHADGYIIMLDASGARIVAEDIGVTNEAIVDPTGRWLYVNETISRCTSRFEIQADGSLGAVRVPGWVITPPVVMWPMRLPSPSVNQSAPSGPAAMSPTPCPAAPDEGNIVIPPVEVACGGTGSRPILSTPAAGIQLAPSGTTVMPSGSLSAFGTLYCVTAPRGMVMRPIWSSAGGVNQRFPSGPSVI